MRFSAVFRFISHKMWRFPRRARAAGNVVSLRSYSEPVGHQIWPTACRRRRAVWTEIDNQRLGVWQTAVDDPLLLNKHVMNAADVVMATGDAAAAAVTFPLCLLLRRSRGCVICETDWATPATGRPTAVANNYSKNSNDSSAASRGVL